MVLTAAPFAPETLASSRSGADQRARLLLVTSDLCGRGAEREFCNLARYLPRDRFDVQVALWRRVFDYDLPADVPVFCLNKRRPWHVGRAVRGFQRLVEVLSPDVVFSQLQYVNIVTGTALRLCRQRPAWVCRLTNDPRREIRSPFATWARWSFRRADRVVGCCEGVTREAQTHLRLPSERMQTLWNLVDVDAIDRAASQSASVQKQPGTFVAAHLAQFHPQKNQRMLFEAFARFRGRPAELWMMGRGPLESTLHEHAQRLGIAGQVRWLGFQANPYPLLREADCLVLSSDYEGLPNVILESLACGTPVCTTRCRFGPEELLEDGVDGWLSPVGDADALAKSLERIVADPARSRQMGAVGRERVRQRFAPARVCQTYAELFEQLAPPTRASAAGIAAGQA